MLPLSLTRKTYVIVSLIFAVPMLIFGWINYHDNKELIIRENTLTLLTITNMLEQRLPGSYGEILKQEGAETLDDRQKAKALNKRLQPVVDEIARLFPENGMGYGMYRQPLAFHPYDEERFTKRTSDAVMEVYDTKTAQVIFNPGAAVWGGQPTLSVNYPLYYNGQIIGHAWANIKFAKINGQLMLILWRNLFILIMVWLLLLFVLRQVFNRIESGLAEFAKQLNQQVISTSKLREFPELLSLRQLVTANIDEAVGKEKQRREALEKFEVIFRCSDNPMWLVEASDMRITDVNHAWEALFGFSAGDAIGHSSESLEIISLSQQDVKNYRLKLSSEGASHGEVTIRRKDGEARLVLASSSKIAIDQETYYFYSAYDITEIRKMEQEIARMDRLNIIGEMAAGIGHEVRNPMTTVRGYLQILQRKAELAKYAGQFDTMIEELDRANAIISEYLALAKDKRIEMKTANLNDILKSLRPLLRADAVQKGHVINFRTAPIPDLDLDESEVRQLVLNLVRNAFEAMPANGSVTITTYAEQGEIVLAVKDTGTGIPKHMRKKIGTPFQTTKDNGTGLGLSICYRIAQRHNAKIDFVTGPEGTTFYIRFNTRRSV